MLLIDDYTFVGLSIDTFRGLVKFLPEDLQPTMNTFMKVWLNDLPYDELENCFTEEELQVVETYRKLLYNQ